MQNVRFALVLAVLLTAAFALVLWCWARPDTHPLLAVLLAALLTFAFTYLWCRRRSRINESFYVQLLRHLPTRLRVRDTRGRLVLDNHPGARDAVVLRSNLPLDSDEAPGDLSPVSKRAWEGLREVRATGRRQDMRIELPAGDGRPARAYRQIFFPIRNTRRRIRALGSLLIDESDLHNTARALRALTDDLEAQVRERTRELARAKEAAEHQAELRAEFMAHLSHEIRSPLSVLIGLSHLARRHTRDPRLDGYLDKMRRASEHLLEIVNDVLDLSRLDAGRLPITQVPFKPGELVWNVVDMISESAREKGLAVGVELDEYLPASLHGDPLRLSQVLINLAGNAVKFTAEGRIDLRLRVLEQNNERVRLRFEVEDTGMGIASEDLPLLFQPFSQLAARVDRSSGSGLGLAISSRLATLMGGELGVRSAPGKGSLFYLDVSFRVAGQAGSEEESDPPVGERPFARFAGHTVLLVDDDPLIREVSSELLQSLGLRVRMAADGLQALHCLRSETDIDVVCMDLQMPHMDGLEATRQLRRSWPHLPVIAMTGNTREKVREECRAAGMSDFLAKPVTLEQLMMVLRRWLHDSPSAESEAAVAPGQGQPLRDIPGLDQAAALERMLGNQALYVRMLRRCHEEYATLPADLRDMLESGRRDEATELLHRAKSMIATLGAVHLQALAVELEAALLAEREWSAELAAFEAEFTRLHSEVQEALEEAAGAG